MTLNPASKKLDDEKFVTILPNLLPGALHKSNTGCIDWSYSGLIAYGCHSHIIIYDQKSLELIQYLSFHKDIVSKISWKPLSNVSIESSRKEFMVLLSGDMSGTIYVSNIKDKTVMASSLKNGGAILQLKWCTFPEQKDFFILALLNPDTFILFNECNLEIKWKFKFNDPVFSFSINNNCLTEISVATQINISIYSDFSPVNPPKHVSKILTVSQQNNILNISASGHPERIHTYFPESNDKPPKSILSAASDVFRVIQGKAQEKINNQLSELVESAFKIKFMAYSSCIPNNLFILINSQTIFVYNLDTNQIMTQYNDQNTIEFLVPFNHSDAFLICYSNTFSFFVAYKNLFYQNSSSTSWGDSFTNDDKNKEASGSSNSTMFNYIQLAGIEPIRLGRSLAISCFAFNPQNETEFICITKTGVIIMYYLPFVSHPSKSMSFPFYPSANIRQFLSQLDSIYLQNINSTDKLQPRKELRCNQRALLFPVNINPTCLRVSPPTVARNNRLYHQYVAVGFHDGTIQIYYLPYSVLRRTFNVFSSPVKQIAWLSPTLLIAYPSVNGFNKPEVNIIDTQTGYIFPLNIPNSEKPDSLRSIKVSHNRNYFVLVFNYGQSQLWDARSLNFLQNILSPTTVLQCVDWKINDLSLSLEDLTPPKSLPDFDDSLDDFEEIIKNDTIVIDSSFKKERLFVVDNRGTLRQLLIDGNNIKEISCTQNELGINLITSIASKGDTVMAADSEGSICLYDIKQNSSKVYQNKITTIKNIRFGSGSGNPLISILFNDSFQIWNYSSLSIIKDSKRYGDLIPIDIDWVSNDMAIIIYNDGTIQVMDLMKHNFLYDSASMKLSKQIFTTYYLSNENYLTLKMLLTYHLVWDNIFEVDILDTILTKDITTNDRLSIISHLKLFYENYNMHISPLVSLTKNALNISRILGEEFDGIFWYVTDFYAHYYSKIALLDRSNQSDLDLACGTICDKINLNNFYTWKTMHEKTINGRKSINPLANYSISKWLIYLKQYDEAIKLLASLDDQFPNFYVDILRAMIIEQFNQSPSIDTKMHIYLATKLMSLNRIDESIEILILAGKHMEACAYLLENNRIYLASILAKILLNSSDLDLFASYLDKKQGCVIKSIPAIMNHILFMISANKFDVAIKMLYENGRVDLAFLLLHVCKKNEINLNCANPINDTPLISDLEKVVQDTFSSYLKNLRIIDKKYGLESIIEL